jgi:rsbT co-antagonist protein RsbR
MWLQPRWNVEYLGGTECVLGQSHYEVFPECPERWGAAHRRGQAGENCPGRGGCMPARRWLGNMGEMRSDLWRAANGDVGSIIVFTEGITER